MSYIGTTNFGLEAALGKVAGYLAYNKFGRAVDCDNGVSTDIWDGADGTTSTDIWVPPTAARIHNITSVAADTAAGTGMQAVRIYGLQTWASEESSEDVEMAGVSNVATANSYVIIYRMKGVRFGSGGTNAGVAIATAVTDGTITAAIKATRGQSQMAIMAAPSGTKLTIGALTGRVIGNAAPQIEGLLLVDERADQSDSGFLVKGDFTFSQDVPFRQEYNPPKMFAGPCIAKIQVASDTNNVICTAEFDGYIATN